MPKRASKPRANLQLRSKVARRTALLALTSLTAPVAALPVTTVATATAAEPPLTALLAQHATGRGVRPLLLNVGSRNDLGGEVQPLAEVVETLGGESVVVVLPRELGLDVAAGGQGLAGLDDIEVADAGLVGRLIAANGNELAFAVSVIEDECSVVVGGSVSWLTCSTSLEGKSKTWFLMESGGTYFFAATMTPSRKRYCLEC
jgi:hypothetical protein